MAKIINGRKSTSLIAGIVLIVLGVLTIVVSYTNASIISKLLSYAIAGVLTISAIVILIYTLVDDKREFFTIDLVLSAVLIAFGVVLFLKPNFIGEIVVNFFSAFAIAYAVIELIKGIMLIKYKAKVIYPVLSFILVALFLAVGIYSLAVNSGPVLTASYAVIGASFVLAGIDQVVYAFKKR